MNKREFFKSSTVKIGATLATFIGLSKVTEAVPSKRTEIFTVPDNMTKVNIKSLVDNKILFDYTIDVTPGQVFWVTPKA